MTWKRRQKIPREGPVVSRWEQTYPLVQGAGMVCLHAEFGIPADMEGCHLGSNYQSTLRKSLDRVITNMKFGNGQH